MKENARRHPNVINLSEAEPHTNARGTRFGCTDKWLADETGAKGIGCSWYEVPPGRAAFPFHYHSANEESVFVLEGEGTLRLGGEVIALRTNDYVTFLAGSEQPHQITNTGAGPLRYLCLSTQVLPEIVGYPDSGKIGARESWTVRRLFRLTDAVDDYYDGEKAD